MIKKPKHWSEVPEGQRPFMRLSEARPKSGTWCQLVHRTMGVICAAYATYMDYDDTGHWANCCFYKTASPDDLWRPTDGSLVVPIEISDLRDSFSVPRGVPVEALLCKTAEFRVCEAIDFPKEHSVKWVDGDWSEDILIFDRWRPIDPRRASDRRHA